MTLFRQLNQTTQGGGGGNNFSYNLIGPSEEITIPFGQEMLVSNEIDVQGLLIIEGALKLVTSDEGFGFPELIEPNTSYAIPVNRQVLLQGVLDNQGLLENYGNLVLLA